MPYHGQNRLWKLLESLYIKALEMQQLKIRAFLYSFLLKNFQVNFTILLQIRK